MSSFTSGLVSSILNTPLDYYKINMQQQKLICYRNSFKNFPIVFIHEVPANMIFFTSYYNCKKHKINYYLSGAISSFLCTIIIYPLNTVKTRMQCNMNLTIKNALIKKGLYAGIQYSLIRGVCCATIGLPTFEFFNVPY